MADLNPLIRVRKHAVEQKQKFLAELYRHAEQLAGQKQALLDQLREEQERLRGSDSIDMIRSLSVFSQAVKGRVADIDEAMRALDQRIEIAREDMRSAFAELKKIEITQERREAAEITALEKKQAQLLDETGLENFRRLKET